MRALASRSCLCLGTLVCFVAGALAAQAATPDTTLAAAQILLDEIKDRDEKTGFEYTAETYVIYGSRVDSILLQGSASVRHKDAQLEAAEMIYRRAQEEVEARAMLDSNGVLTGTPVLVHGDETLRGKRILYDMKTGQGTILEGRIRREKGFYAGRQIRTRSAAEFHVHRGSYTTCDQAAPHFDFYSPRIKVLVDEMAIARPVYLRIKEKRVFWIPFYIFSLRQDRQSGVLTPSFGHRPIRFGSRESEWELRNLGYYIAPNDYWDLTFSGDFRQRSGWLARARLGYARRYHWNGQIETRLENRQDGARTRWEWWTSVRHNQELGESARLRASGTFQSNKDFARDNSSNLQDRLNRTLRSNVSFNKRWRPSGNSLSVSASQTKNLDTESFNTILPDVSFRTSRKALWTSSEGGRKTTKKPWYSQIYYNGDARLRNTRRGTTADTTTRTSTDFAFRLSSQQRPLSWLHLNPSLSETWKDADLRSSDPSSRGVRTDRLSTSAGLTQTLYGLFHPQFWRVTAFRHVLKPNLSLNYQATRTDTGGVLGFGGEGSPLKQTRRVTMRLDNTFWIKMQRDEEEDKIRLAQLNFSTSYNMDAKKRPLNDLVSTLSLNAGRYVDSRFTLRSEFYDDEDQLHLLSPRLERFEARSSLRFSRRSAAGDRESDREEGNSLYGRSSTPRDSDFSSSPYGSSRQQENFGFESGLQRDIRRQDRRQSFQLSHYYSRTRSFTRTIKRSWLRTAAGTGWRQRWHLQYSLNYNLHDPDEPFFATARITSELLSIQREFHDWTASFNLEPSHFHRNRAFYFKAQFKDIPQIKFERGDRRL